MRRSAPFAAAVALLAGGLGPGTAPAKAAGTVEVMVVGKTRTLAAPTEVRLAARRVKVGSRRCSVAGATPLAALLATRLRVEVRDYGSCGRASRDAGGLFVRRVGPDANRGDDGWFYKVGRRSGSAGAGDPAGPFGDGRRLRAGQRVTWFWCDTGRDGGCQRTLETRPSATSVTPGATLTVKVTGYDNEGRGVAAAGAEVRLGEAVATANDQGVASLPVPATASGPLSLKASAPGMIDAFPRRVAVR